MHSVTVSVDVSDTCEITSVVSNEAVDAKGSGNTEVDWEVTGALTVDLRAERSGQGDGRVYTITVVCTDDAGARALGSVTVAVAHDQGKGKAKGRS